MPRVDALQQNPCPRRTLSGAFRDRQGGMTAFALLWAIGAIALGGFAVDTAKAWRMKTMMQAASDAAAQAALHAMIAGEDPVAAARRYVELNLPQETFGELLRLGDVELGGWSDATLSFTPGAEFGRAVRVTLYRAERNGNPEPTTLLRILGIRSWDMSVQTVAGATTSFDWDAADADPCLAQGVAARGTVSIPTNDAFDKVCVHGETALEITGGSWYVNETTVSTPDPSRLNGGAEIIAQKNWGLLQSLAYVSRPLDAVDHADALVQGFAMEATPVAFAEWTPEALRDGDRWYVHCSYPGTIMLPEGDFDDVQITTNCSIRFMGAGTYSNSVIGTTEDAAQGGGALDAVVERILFGDLAGAPAWEGMTTRLAGALGLVAEAQDAAAGWAVQGAPGLNFGAEDDCADGGGTLLIADGAVQIASGAGLHGSTVIASQDVQFAGPASGFLGAAVVAGGDVELPSRSVFKGCNGTDWQLSLRSVRRLLN